MVDPAPHIVVGVDGSKSSIEAMRWAARLAPTLGAYIDAVTVWHYPATYAPFALLPMDYHPDADAHEIVDNVLKEVFGSELPADLVVTVQQGHPAAVLTAVSEHATMLVLGSRGHACS